MGEESLRDVCRRGLIRFSKRAFGIIPPMDKPRILDIGCGSGESVLALAEISGGEIVAVDNDPTILQRFKKKIEEGKLSRRISLLRESMFDLPFAPQSFDIIWSEGAISVAGFSRGLSEWGRYLKSPGFMVIHDDGSDLPGKKELIHRHEFDLMADFVLDEKVWWEHYYAIAEKNMNRFRRMAKSCRFLQEELDGLEKELKQFRENPKKFTSVFFIMRK